MKIAHILDFFRFTYHKKINPILWTKTSEAFFETITLLARPGDTILEIGSGTAHISYMLAKKGFSITLNEIRKDILDYSIRQFTQHHVDIKQIPGDFFKIKKTFDFSWNSGLIQCLPDPKKKEFVRKLSEVSPKVLLFYPDINNKNKVKGQNTKNIPGVDDAKEYNINTVPIIMQKYFSSIRVGTLRAKRVGLPYAMLWIYGENTW